MPEYKQAYSRVYGRRKGHKLRVQQKALMENLLPRLNIDLEKCEEKIEPQSFFACNIKEVWLEIGFGAGEHTAWQAKQNPNIGFIACEPFLNGVASLLKRISTEKLCNIRIFTDDALPLITRLSEGTINRVFLLFPDPWPKSRHKKRRIITTDNVINFANIIADNGEFRFSTDHTEYSRWTLLIMLNHQWFHWTAEKSSDWTNRPKDWPLTRYECKALKDNKKPIFLQFRRLPRKVTNSKLLKNIEIA